MTEEQGSASSDGQAALQLDRPANVAGVAFASRFLDVGANGIQLVGEALDILRGEMGIRLDVSDGHECVFLDLQSAVARSGGYAGVDAITWTVLIAGAEITDMSVLQGQHAGLADAHPAAERHLDADLLAGFQK